MTSTDLFLHFSVLKRFLNNIIRIKRNNSSNNRNSSKWFGNTFFSFCARRNKYNSYPYLAISQRAKYTFDGLAT